MIMLGKAEDGTAPAVVVGRISPKADVCMSEKIRNNLPYLCFYVSHKFIYDPIKKRILGRKSVYCTYTRTKTDREMYELLKTVRPFEQIILFARCFENSYVSSKTNSIKHASVCKVESFILPSRISDIALSEYLSTGRTIPEFKRDNLGLYGSDHIGSDGDYLF